MSLHLKIKTKHLAAEAKIIKEEEYKLKRLIRKRTKSRNRYIRTLNEISDHRKTIVRDACRSTHLAYGFLRGRKYRQMEDQRTKTFPNWKEVSRMIVKYSSEDSRVVLQKFAEWKDQD